MKKWRETNIGKGIKHPKSKQMVGLNNKNTLKIKLKKQKEKQQKLLKIIRNEMKKYEQFRISIEGLEKLSEYSVKSIQKKRNKTLISLNRSMKELLALVHIMEKTENQFRKTL